MTSLAACFLLLTTVPYEAAVTDQFDVCHLQHYYDNEARHVFSQLLWKRWNACDGRYDVEAWRLVKQGEPKPMSGEVLFYDNGVLRQVKHHRFMETHDQWDEELEQRAVKDKEHRRELSKPLTRKSLNQ